MRTKLAMLMLVVLGVVANREAQAFYNPSTGRWLSRDPIAERGGRNLYGFAGNDLVQRFDPLGQESGPNGYPNLQPTFPPSMPYFPPVASSPKKKCGVCGPEVGSQLLKVLEKVGKDFSKLDDAGKSEACSKSYLLGHWDLSFPGPPDGCGTGDCKGTVSVNGRCYHSAVVNYVMFGRIAKLCNMYRTTMQSMIAGNKVVIKPFWQSVSPEPYEWQYTEDVTTFANLGYDMDLSANIPPSSHGYGDCKKCDKNFHGKKLPPIGKDWPP